MFFLKKCYNSFFKIMNESQLRDKINTIHTYIKKTELFLTFKKNTKWWNCLYMHFITVTTCILVFVFKEKWHCWICKTWESQGCTNVGPIFWDFNMIFRPKNISTLYINIHKYVGSTYNKSPRTTAYMRQLNLPPLIWNVSQR